MDSPFSDPKPTLFTCNPGWSDLVTYRISNKAGIHEALQKLAPVFARYNPALPYLYKFADYSYAAKFKSEVLVGKLSGIFAVLAIFISCLCLFGLASYTAEQRNKEIGIRKVLGASVGTIWFMLSKEFLVLVAISAIIASPMVLYFLHDWLGKYSYRITMSPWIFIGTTCVALFITLITISFQALKAGLTNPVKSLKSE